MLKCFQLMNGQDIIGDEVYSDANIVELKNPAAIHIVPSNEGQNSFGVALMPFVPYADSAKIKIHKDKVTIEYDPSIDLQNNYSRLFGAGIQIAKSLI